MKSQSLKNIGGHLVWEFCRVSFYSFFILIKEGGKRGDTSQSKGTENSNTCTLLKVSQLHALHLVLGAFLSQEESYPSLLLMLFGPNYAHSYCQL